MTLKSKNIHVLPTDKPSRLQLFEGINEFEFELCSKDSFFNKGVHIYITSDEEIKDCYYFNSKDNAVRKKNNLNHPYHHKIILTTDQDLIKDGVWGIEDGFLEWFVKNPTCEYVELKGYAIVLPGESCDCDNKCDTCKEEEPKQEKLEEAASTYFETLPEPHNDYLSNPKNGFIAGAKWQQEQDSQEIQELKNRLDTVRESSSKTIELVEKLQQQCYSEEDMKEAIKFGSDGMYGWQLGEEGYTVNQIERFLKTLK